MEDRKKKVLVIIPAYNEAENIVHVVKHMTEVAPQYDYLVINDGSTDDTPDLCRRENFHYLDLPINMGIGGAVQAGYIYARKYALGSRFLEKEGFQSSATRRLGINILSGLIWMVTGKRVMDVTSGYRAVNRKFIEIYSKDFPMDYSEPEAIVSAVMHRGRIKEIPVQMRAREGGVSSITFKKSIYYMIKVTLAILICRMSYGIRRAKREELVNPRGKE